MAINKQSLRIHAVWLIVCGAVWYFSRNDAARDAAAGGPQLPVVKPRPAAQTTAVPAAPASSTATLIVEMAERISRMTPVEYGARYTELLVGPESSRSLLERAAMLAEIDAGRAAAAYLAYKKRTGATFTENSSAIRPMLTAAGEREGLRALQAMEQTNPEFHELDSLIHGWAMKKPQEAVSWFNSLPEDAPRQADALSGLMWGVGQGDPATARAVFLKLSPDDQLTSVSGLAQSLYTSRGPAGLEALLPGMSPEMSAKLILSAVPRTRSRSPGEVVPWLAGYVASVPATAVPFRTAWQRWQATDPQAARAWQQSHPEFESVINDQEAP